MLLSVHKCSVFGQGYAIQIASYERHDGLEKCASDCTGRLRAVRLTAHNTGTDHVVRNSFSMRRLKIIPLSTAGAERISCAVVRRFSAGSADRVILTQSGVKDAQRSVACRPSDIAGTSHAFQKIQHAARTLCWISELVDSSRAEELAFGGDGDVGSADSIRGGLKHDPRGRVIEPVPEVARALQPPARVRPGAQFQFEV